jgi:two-component system CheB/CheR fusion protein
MKNDPRESPEELRFITDCMPVAAVRCDREGRFLWTNALYAKWAARAPGALVGARLVEVIGERALREVQPYLDRLLAGEPASYERFVEMPGLGRRWVRWAYTPTRDRGGAVDGWVATGMDIHGAKEVERKRDEFLAALAHELRNPLAPLRNAAAILGRKGSLDPEVAWSQGVIERQLEQLSRLIEDLLDIERISRGSFVLQKARLPLEAVIDMALEASRPQINAAGHHLSVLLPTERVTVEADAPRLAQALSTVLRGAAARMQKRGAVNVSATVESGAVLVRIEDGGSFPASAADGNVGLTLARGIVSLHQGSLELRRGESGEGTEVLVRLPLARGPTAAPSPSQERQPAASLRILVADDNRDAADSLQKILALYGHEVRVAYDGAQALALGEEFRPRVAILDIGMPGSDGYDVARKLRTRHGSRLTLVALTGWSQEADRRRAREAGFDHHLTKPVDPQSLNSLLADAAKN